MPVDVSLRRSKEEVVEQGKRKHTDNPLKELLLQLTITIIINRLGFICTCFCSHFLPVASVALR